MRWIWLLIPMLAGCASLGDATTAGVQFAASEQSKPVREAVETAVEATPIGFVAKPVAFAAAVLAGIVIFALKGKKKK